MGPFPVRKELGGYISGRQGALNDLLECKADFGNKSQFVGMGKETGITAMKCVNTENGALRSKNLVIKFRRRARVSATPRICSFIGNIRGLQLLFYSIRSYFYATKMTI